LAGNSKKFIAKTVCPLSILMKSKNWYYPSLNWYYPSLNWYYPSLK